MSSNSFYTFIFTNGKESVTLNVSKDLTIEELINEFFKKKQKANLIVENFEETYFHYNGRKITYKDNKEKIGDFFEFHLVKIFVERLEYNDNIFIDYEITDLIKDNLYTSVHKAKIKNNRYSVQYVAIKKINKDKIKEDMKLNLYKEEISDEDFLPEINKFNKEIRNMIKCHCENSVKIYDYFDREKEFIIIMELCDDNLFKELIRRKICFNENEIREILLQLNNAFKKMNENRISHRDIKLNNILVKYLNEEKTKFKVLLSDYGISNQLSSLTSKYTTLLGTTCIMAPEILKGEEYNDKCDLWSIGVIIYQLYTKNLPYLGDRELVILNNIKKKGKSILEVIKDDKLKDLLSKLLDNNPIERISWEEYFKHPFFQ